MLTMVVSYTRELADFCEVEWRRQKTFDAIDYKASTKKPQTSTPVVELRPFRQKEWTRETSLPCVANTTPRSARDNTVVPKFTFSKDLVQSSSDIPQVHVINLTEQTFPKTKNGQHPHIEVRPYWRYQNHHGFTTLGERTKSTLEDIRSGNSVSKSFSCSKQALTPRDVNKIQEIRLCGAKMRKDIGKRRLQYLDPWAKYEQKELHTVGEQRKSNFYKDMNVACFSFDGIPHVVYDSFDLAGSLPSLHINHSTPKGQRIRQGSRSRSGKRTDSWRRTGGIKNSFQIMSENGPPATIERQLTMELGIKLEKLRRNRETPINACTQPLRRFQQVTYRSGPTTGEIQLQRGLTMNSMRSRRDVDEFVDMAGDPAAASRSTTHTKTECRDSGIQSPVDTDDEDEDSISLGKNPPRQTPEDASARSQLAEENSVQPGKIAEIDHADEKVIGDESDALNANARPMTQAESTGKERSKSASDPGTPLDDSLTILTVARENVSTTERASDLRKPTLHLPEISPSAVAIL